MPYLVLTDPEAQANADKRRHEILRSQREHISETYRKRLGGIETWPAERRRAHYAAHPALAAGVTIEDWLRAYDHKAEGEKLQIEWQERAVALLSSLPPQQYEPGTEALPEPVETPNYGLRRQLYQISAAKALRGEWSPCFLLTSYWRELYTFNPGRCVKLLRDYRDMMRESR